MLHDGRCSHARAQQNFGNFILHAIAKGKK